MNEPKIINSIVEPTAKLGTNTIVWHFSHIDSYAEIGNDTKIGQGCYIGKHVKIGKRCRIQNNVNIFTGVTVGNDVFIGPNVTFTNVKKPKPGVVIPTEEYQKTIIKDKVVIGASATILCGITINEGAFIGAGAVVLKDVPMNATVIGNPGVIQRRKVKKSKRKKINNFN